MGDTHTKNKNEKKKHDILYVQDFTVLELFGMINFSQSPLSQSSFDPCMASLI